MANEDEEVIIDNRIEVLANAMSDPDVDISDIETHSDLEVLMKRAVIAIRDLQISSSSGTKWGQIGGNLPDQTDLRNSLSGKASTSDLAAIDTRTRTLEGTITTKADQSALDAKANTADVEAAFAQLMPVINGKATAKPWDDVEIPVSGWSASKPYTQTVTVNGMLATYTPLADVIFDDNADDATIEAEESYYNCVKRIIAGDNSITLVCTSEKPAGTFHIHLKEVS